MVPERHPERKPGSGLFRRAWIPASVGMTERGFDRERTLVVVQPGVKCPTEFMKSNTKGLKTGGESARIFFTISDNYEAFGSSLDEKSHRAVRLKDGHGGLSGSGHKARPSRSLFCEDME